MPDSPADDPQKIIEELKKEIEALKAGQSGTDGDLEGLKRNRDDLLKEKKALQKKVDQYEEDRKKTEQERMEKNNEFQELSQMLKAENEALKQEKEKLLRVTHFQTVAAEHGLSPEYTDFVFGSADIQYDDEGKPIDVQPYFESLKETKPAFFQSTGQRPLQTDRGRSNIGNSNIKPFTREQIRAMDHEEKMKNMPEIEKQMKAGLIT